MIAALLALTLACTSEQERTCAEVAQEAPSLQLGTGAVLFEPLADGDDLAFYQGPQGGFHVFGSLRAHGFLPGDVDDYSHPDNPLVDYVVTRDGAPFGGYEGLPRPLKVRSDGTLEMVGDYLVLAIGSRDEAIGVEVQLDLTLTDVCGTELHETRRVTLVPQE